MKEEEYINLENLTKVRTLLSLVRDLSADEIIKIEDRNKIESQLMDWRQGLEKKVKIK